MTSVGDSRFELRRNNDMRSSSKKKQQQQNSTNNGNALDSSERRHGRRLQRLAMAASTRIKKVASSNSIKKTKKKRRASLPGRMPCSNNDKGDIAIIMGRNQVAVVPSDCKVTKISTKKNNKENDPRMDDRCSSRFQRHKDREAKGGQENSSFHRRSQRRSKKEVVPRFIKPIPYQDSTNSLGSLRIDSIPSFCKVGIDLDEALYSPQQHERRDTFSTVSTSGTSMSSGANSPASTPPKSPKNLTFCDGGSRWIQKTPKWRMHPSRDNLQTKRASISEVEEDFFLLDLEAEEEVALVGSSHYKKYLDGVSF